MAALRNGSKCSHTTCMLRFFTVSRLALNPNLIFEIGSNISGMVIFEKALSHNMSRVYSLDTKARFFYINPKKASSHQSYKK